VEQRPQVTKTTDDGELGTPTNDRFSSGYDFLLVNSDILEITISEVMRCVTRYRRNSKVVLILVTYGGDANPPYRIGRYLQTMYNDIVAFIPAECKSAGTLLVTAANSIVISPFGEIGPLDVQLLQRDELGGRRSGLTTRSALEDLKGHSFELFEHIMSEIKRKSVSSISFRLAADIASRMSSRLLARVYEQINPADLGQDNRDLNVAFQYGERLSRRFSNLKPNALKRLVYDYPSHDFVIDLEESSRNICACETAYGHFG
jgi:Serine dehydrogenase proteinase